MKVTAVLTFAISAGLASGPIKTSASTSTTAIGDSTAQELLDRYAIFRWEASDSFTKESFAFELNEPSNLQVTDFKHHGDMFDVYDNSKLIGKTSLVVYDGNVKIYASTPQEALVDDRFSKGAFPLDKGLHNITIMAHGPFVTGSAALRLTQRTNLIPTKGQDMTQGSKDQEEEKVEVSDWNRVFLKKKIDTGADRPGINHHLDRPHRVDRAGPKTITHWKVARETAIPYAKRVEFETDDDI